MFELVMILQTQKQLLYCGHVCLDYALSHVCQVALIFAAGFVFQYDASMLVANELSLFFGEVDPFKHFESHH